MTLAERWKAERLPDYSSVSAWAKHIQAIDHMASVAIDRGKTHIKFSDGSVHELDTIDRA